MRGKVTAKGYTLLGSGITPAYAGKSGLRSKVERNHGDHPRLCGEKVSGGVTSVSPIGSPPPMRGKEQLVDLSGFEDRITPAYAGKSSRYRLISISSRDHPRLCGEKLQRKP